MKVIMCVIIVRYNILIFYRYCWGALTADASQYLKGAQAIKRRLQGAYTIRERGKYND